MLLSNYVVLNHEECKTKEELREGLLRQIEKGDSIEVKWPGGKSVFSLVEGGSQEYSLQMKRNQVILGGSEMDEESFRKRYPDLKDTYDSFPEWFSSEIEGEFGYIQKIEIHSSF